MRKNKIYSFLLLFITSLMLNVNIFSFTASATTVNDMPQNLKYAVEWVWNNRIAPADYRNLIFDQIFAGKGTLNYVVRWQSSKNVTLQQRQKIAKMIDRQINNWAKHLEGYDGWPYKKISVKVVGWACANPSQILDKQPNEKVYTDYITDDLSKTDPNIPSKLPVAPNEISRFEHFRNPNYNYPGGLDKRFDMYLWGTSNFGGGAGGDWGQRISDDYILNTVDLNEVHIIEHEIGHGFGLPDFYQANERPPGGFPVPTIMWAGNSATITEMDVWMLRYTWSQIRKDSSRFPASANDDSSNNGNSSNDEDNSNDNGTLVNIAPNAKVSTSYVSSWEDIKAINDGFTPVNSNDRNHLVYGNWPRTGVQWVQYNFDKAYKISKSDIYWFKDNLGIDVPNSYKIKYLNGSKWEEVKNPNGLGTKINKFNTTTFTPVSTKSIRIEITSNADSTGILEWRILAAK